jgi:hypothetical protein
VVLHRVELVETPVPVGLQERGADLPVDFRSS